MWKRKRSSTDKNTQFFKNAGFIAITEIIARLKALIILPLLTHHFGALNYGIWSQVSVLVATITPLIFLGTSTAIIRYLPGRPLDEQRRWFYTWSVFILLLTALAGCLISFFKIPITHVFFGTNREYSLYIPLAAASLLATIMINQSRTWFSIHNEAKKYALINFLQSFLSIASVVLIMIKGEGVYQLVTYNVLIDFTLGSVSLSLIMLKNGIGKLDFSVIPILLKYGIPLAPTGFAMWGLNSMDRLFLVKYSTITEIGIYSVVYSLGYLIIQVIVNPIWAMFPNYAAELYNHKQLDQLQVIFKQSINTIALFSFPAIIGIGVISKPLMSLLTTNEFKTGSSLIAVISIGYLCSMIECYYEVLLGLVYRQYYGTISIILGCLLNLVLNFLLIPAYSIKGAALATSAAFVFQMVLTRYIARRYIKINLDVLYICKVILASAIMGCCVYLLNRVTAFNGYWEIIISVITGIVIYGLLVLSLKVIPNTSIKKINIL